MSTTPRDVRREDGTLVLLLTEFQANEIQYGMEIDATDGNADWGVLAFADRQWHSPAWLTIRPGQVNLDAALYRVTSSRDIHADNAADPFSTGRERLACLSRAKSLDSLTRRLVAIAGGRDAFSPEVRRWISR